MSQARRDADLIRGMLLQMNDLIEPMHEWLAGQVGYFLAQGYGPDDARVMAAAEFVSAFGNAIYRTPARPEAA